jgi:hypothetical protein
MLIELIEIFQRGFNRVGLLDAAGYRLESFVTVGSDADNDRFITRNSSFLDEFPGYRDFGYSRRLGKDSFSPCEQLDPFNNFFIRDTLTPTAGLFDRVNDVVAICRIANRDRTRNRVGLYRNYHIRALMKRIDDRSASSGLRRVNLATGILHQSHFGELLERLGELGQNGSTRRGNHDVFRKLPT